MIELKSSESFFSFSVKDQSVINEVKTRDWRKARQNFKGA